MGIAENVAIQAHLKKIGDALVQILAELQKMNARSDGEKR